MSNLLTLTDAEIARFGIKDKVAGDVITAEEYSALEKKAQDADNKAEVAETPKKAK